MYTFIIVSVTLCNDGSSTEFNGNCLVDTTQPKKYLLTSKVHVHHCFSSRSLSGTRCNLAMGAVLRKLLEVFWTKNLDIVVIGLENR